MIANIYIYIYIILIDEVQIVNLCECVQMELNPRLCSCKYSRWLPQSGYRYSACHNVFDVKVNTRKPFRKYREYQIYL